MSARDFVLNVVHLRRERSEIWDTTNALVTELVGLWNFCEKDDFLKIWEQNRVLDIRYDDQGENVH